MQIPMKRVLHIGQSLYRDVEPARVLGIRSVLVNRRCGKVVANAAVESNAKPDLEVPDLKTLAGMTDVAD